MFVIDSLFCEEHGSVIFKNIKLVQKKLLFFKVTIDNVRSYKFIVFNTFFNLKNFMGLYL